MPSGLLGHNDHYNKQSAKTRAASVSVSLPFAKCKMTWHCNQEPETGVSKRCKPCDQNPKQEFETSRDQSNTPKMARHNNETISKLWITKAASKVKTKEGQARSRALDDLATLKPRAVNNYVKGKEEDLRTTFLIVELIGTIPYNTKFKTEQWQAKGLASKCNNASTRPCESQSRTTASLEKHPIWAVH